MTKETPFVRVIVSFTRYSCITLPERRSGEETRHASLLGIEPRLSRPLCPKAVRTVRASASASLRLRSASSRARRAASAARRASSSCSALIAASISASSARARSRSAASAASRAARCASRRASSSSRRSSASAACRASSSTRSRSSFMTDCTCAQRESMLRGRSASESSASCFCARHSESFCCRRLSHSSPRSQIGTRLAARCGVMRCITAICDGVTCTPASRLPLRTTARARPRVPSYDTSCFITLVRSDSMRVDVFFA
mmetsp:Transcript_24988/g.64481  ORF Transcript_24988/g.64481 Transcript_24988/m.64481 type:complete len:260 (+) Transcript_24988:424-1203(+)